MEEKFKRVFFDNYRYKLMEKNKILNARRKKVSFDNHTWGHSNGLWSCCLHFLRVYLIGSGFFIF